jgi:hypothetical protein
MELLSLEIGLGLSVLIGTGFALRYYLTGHHKANVDISFARDAFKFGDAVAGEIDCRFKRQVECRKISVVLYRVERTRPDGRSRIERYVEDKIGIQVQEDLEAGAQLRRSFRLDTPSPSTRVIDGVAHLVDVMFMDGERVEHWWEVEVCIDVDGVDVSYKRRVPIS